MRDADLQALVEEISLKYFDRPFRHQASFNKRLKTTGGRYHLKTHDLDFNPHLLSYFGKEELVGVIKHELCHYHLHLEGKGYRHQDQDFKRLLKEVGGSRYVKDLRPYLVKYYYEYSCQQCHKKIIRQRRVDVTKYVCGTCGGQLHLIARRNKDEEK